MSSEYWKPKFGERVGAYQITEDERFTLFFGYGTYSGEEIPPVTPNWQSFLEAENIVIVGSQGELTKEELEQINSNKSPVISLDSGERIFGIECWWRPQVEFEEPNGILSQRPVRRVTVAEYRLKSYDIGEN